MLDTCVGRSYSPSHLSRACCVDIERLTEFVEQTRLGRTGLPSVQSERFPFSTPHALYTRSNYFLVTVNMSPDTSFAALEGPNRGPRISIQAQTIAGNARVHNGDVYITRRSSTLIKKRQEIFRWLSPLSFHSSHQRIQDGARILEQSDGSRGDIYSGKWLLESDTLDSWRSRKIRKLWYLGMRKAFPFDLVVWA